MEPHINLGHSSSGEGNSLRGSVVTEQLLSDLREQIQKGVLRPGDPIKPVRELAKAYGISYNAVRRVLTQLVDKGLISLERGRGTFVKNAFHPGPPAPVPISSALPQGQGTQTVSPQHHSNTPLPKTPPQPGPRAHILAGRQAYALLTPSEHQARIYGYGPALDAIQGQILENGDCLTLVPCHPKKGWPFPDELLESGFDGVLLFGYLEKEILAAFAESELPCVLINQWQEDLPLTGIVADNFSGAYLLTKRLLNAGHRELCLILGGLPGERPGLPSRSDPNATERINACKLALKEEGLNLRDSHILSLTPEQDAAAVGELISSLHPRPSALLAGDLEMADRVTEAQRARGHTPPRNFSLACFAAKGEANPKSYTCAEIDFRKMGETAVNRMRQLLAGAPGGRLRINIPIDVVQGATVGPFGRS